MKQGEIWLADLNPVKGRKQEGVRPVVVISGNAMNDNLGIGIVCPLTSRVERYAGCIVLKKNKTNGLDQDSEVLTFHIRTVARERLQRKLGAVTKDQLVAVKAGLAEILTY